jgi:long-chain acyl-CoA synthetase
MLDFDLLKSVTIPQMVKRASEIYGPQSAFFHCRDQAWRSLTYNQIAAGLEAVAQGLLASGHSRQSKIAILSENSPEWCLAYLGILSIGGTVVPVDPLLKPNELLNVLKHSESESVFVSARYLGSLREVLRAGLSFRCIIVLDDDSPASDLISLKQLTETGIASEAKLPAVSNLDLAVIIYTSGATGNPKGVMLTHKNILSDLWSIFKVLKLYSGDKFLSVMPLNHSFEATCGFLVPLAVGSSVVYSRSLKSKELVEDMKNHGITVMLGVPLLFEKFWLGLARNVQSRPFLTRLYFSLGCNLGKWLPQTWRFGFGRIYFFFLRKGAGLNSLRLLISGGAALPPAIGENFDILGIKFLQGYGLTETSPVLSLNPEKGYRYDSIGLPLRDVEMRIENPDLQGIGEIVVRGEMVMSGYYRNPQETSKVLKEGWFYTGDSGWKDKGGFFYVAGRIKNVIVTRSGKNVYPEEVEMELVQSPYIAEALVLPREIAGGEEVFALIVPDYDYFTQSSEVAGRTYTESDIQEIIKAEISSGCNNLADYKRVKGFEIRREELEKTSTRKIKRFLFAKKPAPPRQLEIEMEKPEVKT